MQHGLTFCRLKLYTHAHGQNTHVHLKPIRFKCLAFPLCFSCPYFHVLPFDGIARVVVVVVVVGEVVVFVAFYGVLNEAEFRSQKLKLRNEDMPRGHATNKN